MKLLLVTLFVGFAAAAKLSNNYLPPSSAHTSGGHGGFLQGPSGGFGTGHAGAGAGAFGGAFGGHNVLGGGAFAGGHAAGAGAGAGSGAGAYGGQYQHRTPSGPPIPILKYNNIPNAGDGSYQFEFETANGISQQEQGHLNNPGSEYGEQVVQGSYSYTGDDGHQYTVHYKADSNGFQASGDHLPTPPPIPEAIAKSLAYNAAHPSAGGDTGAYSGQYGGGSGAYQPQKQYLPPSRPSFSSGSGYHY